jgi:hypothetical protein
VDGKQSEMAGAEIPEATEYGTMDAAPAVKAAPITVSRRAVTCC